MTPTPNWRDRFIDLAAELCRARGEPEPPRHSDPDRAAHLRLSIDGVDFEALHPAQQDGYADRFLLRCRFGRVGERDEGALRQALEMNFALARSQVGAFGWDADTRELVFCTPQSLQDAAGDSFLTGLRNIAGLALVWQQTNPPARG